MKKGITNWGFIILPQNFKESQIPLLVEKLKEVMKTPMSTDIVIAVDNLENILDDQLTVDIKDMINKYGRPALVGEDIWKEQFTIDFLKGLQSEEAVVRHVGKKVVERIASANVEQQIFLANVGLPTLRAHCVMLAKSFI